MLQGLFVTDRMQTTSEEEEEEVSPTVSQSPCPAVARLESIDDGDAGVVEAVHVLQLGRRLFECDRLSNQQLRIELPGML